MPNRNLFDPRVSDTMMGFRIDSGSKSESEPESDEDEMYSASSISAENIPRCAMILGRIGRTVDANRKAGLFK